MNGRLVIPSISEYVRWRDPRLPELPPTWFPIDREKGKVTTGYMICNNKPKGKVVGEVKFSGDPTNIFSKPIVTFYKNEKKGE